MDPVDPDTEAGLRQRIADLERELADVRRGIGEFAFEPSPPTPPGTAQYGVWVWEPSTNRVIWSDELFSLLGRTRGVHPETVEGFFDAVHPDDLDAVLATRDQIVEDEFPERSDFRIVTPDGAVKWVTSGGATFRNEAGQVLFLGAVVDFTDLLDERDVIDAVMRSTVDGIMIFGRDGQLLHANDATRQLIGVPPDELPELAYNSPAWGITRVDGTPMPDDEYPFRIVRDTGQPVHEHRLAIRSADGSRRIWSVNGVPLLDSHHRVDRVVFAVWDVTEKTRLESELDHARRMEALGQLASGIAHDFNNLLTVILTNAHVASTQLAAAQPNLDQMRSALDDMILASTRGAGLTRQLLDFSRRHEDDRVRPVDVCEEVRDAMRMVAQLTGDGSRVSVDLPTWALRVRTVPGRIEQSVLNLATNALDAVGDSGEVAVIVSSHGNEAVITVRDDGVGISATEHERIFEPFYTTKPAGKGTGLGLSNVRASVRQIGGSVSVESAPGMGSTFTLRIPLDEEWASSSGTHGTASTQPVLLVCDDEEAVLRAVVNVLRASGFHTLEAPDGQSGLELAGQHAIDLLLTDVSMPGLNGVDLADRLREVNPGLPVLLFSGNTADVGLLHRARESGLELLDKPVRPDVLISRIETLLASRKPGDGSDPAPDRNG